MPVLKLNIHPVYLWIFLFHSLRQTPYFCYVHTGTSVCTVCGRTTFSSMDIWIPGRKIHTFCVETTENLYQTTGRMLDRTRKQIHV